MPQIVITEFMDEASVADLKRDFDVHYDRELWSKRAEIEALMADLPALIVRNRTKVDRALIDRGNALKIIGRLGVGLDNIDVAHAKSKGVPVAAAIGSNAVSVAEYVIGMALLLLRGAAYRSTEATLSGQWPREAAGKGREVGGRTMGVIGFGYIGQIVAERARGMGMSVVAFDEYVPGDHPAWANVKRVDLAMLLKVSDVVTLHCPLTPETKGLLGAEQLAAMKPGAVLINSARGTIVDEAALAQALKSGHLGGAALDTFEPEPIDEATRAALAGAPNLILTPHIAGVTAESNVRASSMTAAAVRRVLEGKA
jgi:(S)-sulfolactate dehydrogenase